MSLRSSAEILGLPTRLPDREYAPTPGDASGWLSPAGGLQW